MTASAAIDLQSSVLADSAKSSQATGSEGFSSHFNSETSQRNSTRNSKETHCKDDSCRTASTNRKPKETQTPENREGNNVPEDGNASPKEAAAKDPVDQELDKLEAELNAQLNADQAEVDPVANPLLISAANQKAATAPTALESLQKLYPGATNASPTLPNPQVAGLAANPNGAPPTAATGSAVALELQNQTIGNARATAAIEAAPVEVTETEDSSLDDMLLKMAEGQLNQTQAKTSAGGGQPVNILTAMNDLGRPAFTSSTAAPAPTVPQPALSMQQPGWTQAMGNSVHWMLKENLHEASLRVKPSELGPIHIKLSMNNEQLSLSLNAAHAATREALEANIPRIREVFGASNLNLANVDVSDQNLPQSNPNMEFADFSGEHSWDDTPELASTDRTLTAEEDHDALHLSTGLPVRETAGVLDLFA